MPTPSWGAASRWLWGPPSRPACSATAAWPFRSSATGPPTRASSTSRSTWRPSGACRWCSCARTTAGPSRHRRHTPPASPTLRSGPRRTTCQGWWSTGPTTWTCSPRPATPSIGPGGARGPPWSKPRSPGCAATTWAIPSSTGPVNSAARLGASIPSLGSSTPPTSTSKGARLESRLNSTKRTTRLEPRPGPIRPRWSSTFSKRTNPTGSCRSPRLPRLGRAHSSKPFTKRLPRP